MADRYIELWFMGYLIFCRMGSTPTINLAKQISQMRQMTRKAHKDVFTNSKVVGTIYRWIDKLKVERPGPGQQVAAIEWEGDDPDDSATLAKKRKRDLQEEDEDPDYRGAPNSRMTGRTTVNNAAVKTRNAPTPIQPTSTRPPPPPAPVAQRPSASSMDAAPAGPRVNPGFGQPSQGGVSPYAAQTTVDPRAYQVSFALTLQTIDRSEADISATQWHLRSSSRCSTIPALTLQPRRSTTASSATCRQSSFMGAT